jgi:hypothetical protein
MLELVVRDFRGHHSCRADVVVGHVDRPAVAADMPLPVFTQH